MGSYRILKVSQMQFGSLLHGLVRQHPEWTQFSYENQRQKLEDSGCLYQDSFTQNMSDLGHQAYEVIADFEILQKTWARENNIGYQSHYWQRDILLAQIKNLRPDIICFQDVHSMSYPVRKSLKSQFPFIKKIVVIKGFPGSFDTMDDIDILLVRTPRLLKQYETAGFKPYLVYHAFNHRILDALKVGRTPNSKPVYDFTFIGSSGFGFDLSHQGRYWLLRVLAEKTILRLWIDERQEFEWSWKEGIPKVSQIRFWVWRSLKRTLSIQNDKQLNSLARYKIMPYPVKKVIDEILDEREMMPKANNQSDLSSEKEARIPDKSLKKLFSKKSNDPVYGYDMYRILYDSRITLNRHTDLALDAVGNIRLFQATGMGACLLTDEGSNLSQLFEKDKEIITYQSTSEAIKKVNYLINNESERRAIAEAGQRRTLTEHTTVNRCRLMDEIFQLELKDLPAGTLT